MALNGRVSPGLVMDNVNYYQDYINTEIRKGRTEGNLGIPLIARTIIQTNGGDNRSGYRNTVYGNGEYREAAGRIDLQLYRGRGWLRKHQSKVERSAEASGLGVADPWDSGGSIDLRCGIFRIVFLAPVLISDCGSIVPGEIISGLA